MDVRFVTVSELTARIRALIEGDAFLGGLWVRGEVSNFRRASSGHSYFTLKDSSCAVRTVLFRSRSRFLSFSPENGMAVRVRGYVSVFDKDGTYQLYAEEIEPDGAGAMHQALEQLKARLSAEGLFDAARKRPLPLFPACIGVVTSASGAALRDILRITGRRWPLAAVVLAPATVQGSAAPEEIARGIGLLNGLPEVDVIVVGRGGGSVEELWAFNSELVARAVYASRVPVVAAVGHETDWTLADFVADVRASTPSAAAELVTPDRSELGLFLARLRERLAGAVRRSLEQRQKRLVDLGGRRIFRDPAGVVCGRRSEIMDHLAARLVMASQLTLQQGAARQSTLAGRLESLNPRAVLARGYSICTRAGTGEIIDSADRLAPGERVDVTFHRGQAGCTVDEVRGLPTFETGGFGEVELSSNTPD